MTEGQFRGPPAKIPAIKRNDPLIQWGSNLKVLSGKDTLIWSGWTSECGKDEDFDAIMAEKYESMIVRHLSGERVKHWKIGTMNIVPIMTSVDTLQTIKRSKSVRNGTAIGWRIKDDGRNQSFCKFLGILRDIYPDWEQPVMVTIKSTATNDLTNALWQQYEIFRFIEDKRKEKNQQPANYPFYALSMVVGPGEEVSRGGNIQSPFVPPVNYIEFPLTTKSVADLFIGRDQKLIDLVETYIPIAKEWSEMESELITQEQGDDDQGQDLTRLGHGVH